MELHGSDAGSLGSGSREEKTGTERQMQLTVGGPCGRSRGSDDMTLGVKEKSVSTHIPWDPDQEGSGYSVK